MVVLFPLLFSIFFVNPKKERNKLGKELERSRERERGKGDWEGERSRERERGREKE